MKIVYTNTARRDLREIYEYIAYTLLVPDTAKAVSEKLLREANGGPFVGEPARAQSAVSG